jgi:hypothetical protein
MACRIESGELMHTKVRAQALSWFEDGKRSGKFSAKAIVATPADLLNPSV